MTNRSIHRRRERGAQSPRRAVIARAFFPVALALPAAAHAPHARRSSPPAGMSALAVLLAGLLLVMWPVPRAVAQPCEPEWAEGVFGVRGMSQSVQATVVFDDGTGEALYAGGSFSTAGGVKANCVARWDGSVWMPLGEGMDHHVHALTVFDDGTGPALYAGGLFTAAGGAEANYIARWDGSAWTPLGSGMNSSVDAFAVFNDGTSPALYAGGRFSTAGGVDASRIARWDGAAWTPVGTGIGGTVNALTVFDDGTGPALYVGGGFSTAGGVEAEDIARWDGSAWTPLSTGLSGSFSGVGALAVYDDGTGPALYAGGTFSAAGGVAALNIARWDGSAWTRLGTGSNRHVSAMTVFDDGAGPALYAAGSFTKAGGVEANRIARWDGAVWSPLETGIDGETSPSVSALTVFDDGSGPALYVGGFYDTAGGLTANRIARWDGLTWAPLGSGMNRPAAAFTVFDDGGGPALYAGGWFSSAGDVQANRVVRWDGSAWAPLGTGITGPRGEADVRALAVFDDGRGPALYAGGDFTTAGGMAASNIARWDGSAWTPVGSGVLGGDNYVSALTVFDDGSGRALYAGGKFTFVSGVAANRIARWDGSEWTPLGDGLNNEVFVLTVFDDGAGPALYAGGSFTTAGGVAANRIARWDGSTWTRVGMGFSSAVRALTIFDDGTGPALYAGGSFLRSDLYRVNYIARWGSSTGWTPLGEGMSGTVSALAVFDHGAGPALYAGGVFDTAGGVAANRIARWDGSAWTPLGDGVDEQFTPAVRALTTFDDGSGPALFAGGRFTTAGGVVSGYMARWGCESVPCRADIDGDGELTFFDFLAFQNLFAAGDPRADFDGDGAFTFFDFLAFQDAFAAGCA